MSSKAKKTKTIVKKPNIPKENTKVRKKPQYKSFRLHKSIKHDGPPIPSWWVLFKKATALMNVTKRQLFVFVVIYGILTLLFVRGFGSPFDLGSLNETYKEILSEDIAGLASGFTAFGFLINASTQGVSEVAQTYQSIFLIISSLAIIWLYRQQQAGNKVTMKMAFYRGMYPLIPFVTILVVMGLQLIPAIIGNYLFSTVYQSGLAINTVEQIAWIAFLIFTLIASLYLISGTFIALYIVTLPEMTPMIALREAKQLVKYRRMSIMRKVFALILVVLSILVIIILPIIFFAPSIAEWLFFSMTLLLVPFVHGYMFSLYRELL